LNIDGYYRCAIFDPHTYGYGKQVSLQDSFASNIIFYDDGTFVDLAMGWKPDTQFEWNDHYLKRAIDDSVAAQQFRNGRSWGVYRLCNDTLIVQEIYIRGSMNDQSIITESRFIIVDRNTIKTISSRYKYYQQFNFIPSVIPPSDSWLKDQDWLRCKK
jgi:hypothetical protein